ncbi:hypothetical protein [Saccharothrix xinjiangensis]|uniref:Helix-turn-helix protein n=1 Tax=Saccharothrix xinjiangensis TaxID=204798 RepID=A0ABV9XTQ7_9PSEU
MAETDEELPYVSAREWVDVVSRLRIPEGTGKKVAARTVKGCAFRIAWWADGRDGTRVRPGTALIAVICEVDYQTAKRVVAVLRGLGLLTLVSTSRGPAGGRTHVSDEYRLTIPADLLDRARVLSPNEIRAEAQRIRDANAGRKRVAGDSDTRNCPVDNPPELELQGTEAPATPEVLEEVAGEAGPPNPELRGTAEAVAGDAVPPHLLGDQTTQPINHDHLPAQPPDAREAAKPSKKPAKKIKCDHGLPAGMRADGTPKCAVCRRDAHIAPVIQLPLRRAGAGGSAL